MSRSGRSHELAGALELVAMLAGVLAVGAVAAEDRAGSKPPPQIVYRPPDLGAPATRTIAAARGVGDQPTVQILAPEQTGFALESQPKLVWLVSAPSRAPIELTLIDEQAIEPLLELDLGPVGEPGVHAVDLKDHGVHLKPGVEYRWSVAQVVDPEQRSADAAASATIAVHRPDRTLLAELEAEPPVAKLSLLASHGYWYDVIALLSEEITARPRHAELRQLRADLLDQEGLEEIAEYDRQAAGSQ